MEYNNVPQPAGSRRKPSKVLAALRAVGVLLILGGLIYLLVLGKVFAVVAWLLTIIVLLDNSVNILFGFYGVKESRRLGLLYWIANIFLGAQGAILVTPEGKSLPVRPGQPLASVFAKLGAPGIVIIENGNAVVFEQSGRFTRVAGPGIAFTRRFERVARIVSLFPQYYTEDLRDVQTKDGWQVNILPLHVRYQVICGFDRQAGKYTYDEGIILSLVYEGGYQQSSSQTLDPKERVMRLVERTVRDVLAGKKIRDVVGTSAGSMETSGKRQNLLDTIQERAQEEAQHFGVQIQAIDFGRIEVPKAYHELQVAWARRGVIEEIASGLTSSINNLLTVQSVVEKAEPQTIVMLATLLEKVVQSVVPSPLPAEDTTKKQLPTPPTT